MGGNGKGGEEVEGKGRKQWGKMKENTIYKTTSCTIFILNK